MVSLLLLFLAAPNGEIQEARLEASVGGGPDVAVRLSYRIDARGRDRISFSFLEIDGVAVEEVEALASETRLPVSLEPRSGPKLGGSIGISGDPKAIEVRYVVRGGAESADDGLRVRLPCAILDLRIPETRAGLFTAVVGLPQNLSVVDGFPSHPTAEKAGYRWDLPLVPAFVSFRASPGTELLTAPRIATSAVVVLLLSVSVVGIRRARAFRP